MTEEEKVVQDKINEKLKETKEFVRTKVAELKGYYSEDFLKEVFKNRKYTLTIKDDIGHTSTTTNTIEDMLFFEAIESIV
jgi:hypothetical protein